MAKKILKMDKKRLTAIEPEVVQEETTYVSTRRRPVLHTPATLAEAVGKRAAVLVGKSPLKPATTATRNSSKVATKKTTRRKRVA